MISFKSSVKSSKRDAAVAGPAVDHLRTDLSRRDSLTVCTCIREARSGREHERCDKRVRVAIRELLEASGLSAADVGALAPVPPAAPEEAQ